MPARRVFFWLLLHFGVQVAAASELDALHRGREAFVRRAEGHSGAWAVAGPIDTAIAAFDEVVAADPTNGEALTDLLRALFFKGNYVLRDRDAKLAVFERGQELGEGGISGLLAGTTFERNGGKDPKALVDYLRDQPDAVGIYYWTAANWAGWGRHRGKIAAARKGVASKLRDYAEIVNAVDSTYDRGGGHRMLGRLHAKAPRIPFLTGWIDRDKAISELSAARIIDDNALSSLFFIEALLEYDSARRSEALTLLRELARQHPTSDAVVEEKRALADARTLLESLGD